MMYSAVSTRRSQFIRFAVVGALGFIVDSTTLYLALAWTDLGLYSGRALSYLSAATFTWAANRIFTFPNANPIHAGEQWLKFVSANTIGAMINYGTYAVLVSCINVIAVWPIFGVAIGSLFGLIFNFSISRSWVFKSSL